jgi:hypothetical protein
MMGRDCPCCGRRNECSCSWTASEAELRAENRRLREALQKIAESMVETPVGFQAEYAVMTDAQRAAVDKLRGERATVKR